jgi:hypothetical protein
MSDKKFQKPIPPTLRMECMYLTVYALLFICRDGYGTFLTSRHQSIRPPFDTTSGRPSGGLFRCMYLFSPKIAQVLRKAKME